MSKASELTKEILKYCIEAGHYTVRINNIPYGSGRFKKNIVTKGIADIQGCTGKVLKIDGRDYTSGTKLCIETKTTDKQSKEQKDFEVNITKRGGIYILAKKLEDVTEAI